ncbi:phosphatidylserine decarboxylase [Elasticomyces elasticus]|uniref:Phosphatidylserine decarboxylase proenzyme 2 n=1 Tax=Exophiala sideris TaxID=1016849 RepID=A0ABR0JA07_9EURO|nr:phosphatidylserine decarboxylase [Elasticomyces elasticus]KAK5026134.1 phosphatidylserine decarboxylase [Exophiala sideris]KAK5032388.1 phosphatidylserine decarboxylase [Exophiala sideris]KAK5059544.1 phosphatidylserine decarboxylase [Exophiala sideris]KAK5186706.1 phosphatidylserine decarboxylase [Eurotiomycetes sp. CCFEE 6388]
MVHLSLSRGFSHLHKSKDHNGSSQHNGSQRPDVPRNGSGNNTPPHSDQKPLILKVYVIKARNLAAKDKSGTSDPYLIVTLGTAKQSTPSISKTLNPEWKICFDMPLTGVPLLECICWDRDRFGKDYMGEFDIPIEDIFANGKIQQEPKWYKLKSRRANTKKHSSVSGEVLMEFSIVDSANPSASPEEIRKKFHAYIGAEEEDDELSRLTTNLSTGDDEVDDADDLDDDVESVTETESTHTGGVAAKKEKKKRLARLRRKSMAARAYNFLGAVNDVNGLIFMEIVKINDLPPERNMTRTSFDMDPFIVAALGRKVLRTRVVRHNLNPVFNEKMVFQILQHETGYSLTFTVIDRDSFSGNDFVASTSFPVSKMIEAAPEEDPETGLYDLPDPPEYSPPMMSKEHNRSKFRLPLSRTSSASSLQKLGRPGPRRDDSQTSLSLTPTNSNESPRPPAPTSAPSDGNGSTLKPPGANEIPAPQPADDPSMISYVIPLELKNKERWEAKHRPEVHIRARYLPYKALRQQFWRAMFKQYDADDSKRISKIEFTTMLDTLGSTLKESTIDTFFARFAKENEDVGEVDLTFDQAVICLEEQLQKGSQKKSTTERIKNIMAPSRNQAPQEDPNVTKGETLPGNIPTIQQKATGAAGEEGKLLDDDLGDEGDGEEHVIEIRECPICHQPKLNKRTEADIITHIATCASSDWRQVNNLVMGGFVTQSQAQRKWYSKVITKISYGGYKLGANSANILVQDRTTGQINEERMSVYVRIGIRVLYKALGSREMEKRRIKKMLKSLSVKQGRKFDDPASASQIEGFINFHRLDMSEVLLPKEQFRNFNEFFYRALKPDARPCSAPERPEIIVSPADCRTVVFNTIDDATRIWVKGRDYSLEKLFGDAYPLEAKRFKGGSMGIFRLAPQDYHRFHIPVDGTLGTPKLIEGEYYTVNPMAIRSALDVYGENIRVVVPIDTVCHGRVMYVCIGAMMVGSTVITRKPGERVKRAEELGYFKFGGSTILIFFEPGKMVYDKDLVDNSLGALETLVRVGMSIGHSPDVESYKPDMKKDEGDITAQDRQDAKRRIEGSLASNNDSGGFMGESATVGDGVITLDQAHIQ